MKTFTTFIENNKQMLDFVKSLKIPAQIDSSKYLTDWQSEKFFKYSFSEKKDTIHVFQRKLVTKSKRISQDTSTVSETVYQTMKLNNHDLSSKKNIKMMADNGWSR